MSISSRIFAHFLTTGDPPHSRLGAVEAARSKTPEFSLFPANWRCGLSAGRGRSIKNSPLPPHFQEMEWRPRLLLEALRAQARGGQRSLQALGLAQVPH
jgi:hypothetical protein